VTVCTSCGSVGLDQSWACIPFSGGVLRESATAATTYKAGNTGVFQEQIQ
jgi:hypothetical protein